MFPAKFLSLQTHATGTTWQSWPTYAKAHSLSVVNNTGTTLSFRRTGDTDAVFQLPTGTAWTFRGLTNTDQIQMKRTDDSNTQVTVYGEGESS